MATATTAMAHVPLRHPRLPRWAPALTIAVSIALAAIVGLLLHWSIALIVIVAFVINLVALPAWSRLVENKRAAYDRMTTTLIWGACGVAMVPLASLLITVIGKGAGQLTGKFFTSDMRNLVGEAGGIQHAIIGTALITLLATAISVPIGLLSAVYLVEYGGTARLAGGVRFLVDVMTGIPSIVAGLFAFALFELIFGPGSQMGFGGGIALSLLMIPIVVRASEEMLKLVPNDLREATYALGVPKWKTIMRVVIPTALSGIITGITLAIARVIGETAPLLIICGTTTYVNTDLFTGQMPSLPVFIYFSYTQPGPNPDILKNMAWGAALVLILIVLALNLIARVAGHFLAPKTGH